MAYGGRIESIKFFRRRLLSLTASSDIEKFLSRLSKDQQELRRNLYNIMWHMRGSISREDAFELTPIEREDIRLLIDERMKIVKETHLPLL